MDKLKDIWFLLPIVTVHLIVCFQWFLDVFLNAFFGFRTRSGSEEERKQAQFTYEKSAQVVSIAPVTNELSLKIFSNINQIQLELAIRQKLVSTELFLIVHAFLIASPKYLRMENW